MEKIELQVVAENEAEVNEFKRKVDEQMEKEENDIANAHEKRKQQIISEKRQALD